MYTLTEQPINKKKIGDFSAGDVFAFRSMNICEVVKGIDILIGSNVFCSRVELKETSLFIPTIPLDYLLGGVISYLDSLMKNPETIFPVIHNHIVTDVIDSLFSDEYVDISFKENTDALVTACVILIKEILTSYDDTNNRTDENYVYKLLRITGSGSLIIGRFRTDY